MSPSTPAISGPVLKSPIDGAVRRRDGAPVGLVMAEGKAPHREAVDSSRALGLAIISTVVVATAMVTVIPVFLVL